MYNGSLSSVRAPICSVCRQPVPLNDAKTDEDGSAIHEDCYIAKLRMANPPVGRLAPDSSKDLFTKHRPKRALGN